MGVTSFFSDFGHEMATAVLPAFLVSIGGSAALLGLIEGFADASTSLGKVFSGWYSDHIGTKKPFMNSGYLLTALGVGSIGFATSWFGVLISRVVAWAGRGTRESARDALLLDSTEEKYYGHVFGFHRAMDTLGAILGPAIAFILIKVMPLRPIFFIAFIPSMLAFLTVFFFVKERRKHYENHPLLQDGLKGLPRSFRWYLLAVGLFGLGNFADSILILRTTELLKPVNGAVVAGSLAILLYTIHNVLYAGFSYPVGVLGDKFGKEKLLMIGFLLTGISSVGFIFNSHNIFFLGFFFALAGVAIAICDGMEDATAGDLLPAHLRGTGYGTLAAVNGIGDFISSTTVGFLWEVVSPLAGFGYGAVLTILGALVLFGIRRK